MAGPVRGKHPSAGIKERLDVSSWHNIGATRVTAVNCPWGDMARKHAFHRWDVDGVFGLGGTCAHLSLAKTSGPIRPQGILI